MEKSSIGLTFLAYQLPNKKYNLETLEINNRLTSKAEVLASFGFRESYIIDSIEEGDSLIIESAKKTLQQREKYTDLFEYLFYYSGLNTKSDHQNNLALFHFQAYKFHDFFNLKTNVITFSEQGCSGLLSMIAIAKQILENSKKDSILCLTGDVLPEGSKRDILYNLMSDAGASVIVNRNATENKIIHFYQETQSYYWETEKHPEEILASYFPLAKRTIEKCIDEAGLNIKDIDWFVPHNVSLRSWKILAGLLGIKEEKIWTKNISRVGHTVSCDHIINMSDMQKDGDITKGDYLILFTFGFGATWSCMILEH